MAADLVRRAVTVTDLGLTVTLQQPPLSWGKGSIVPLPAFASDDAQQALVRAVLQSLEPIQESSYSACTDGRLPLRLLDGGTTIPVREQLAGADIVCAFFVAEVLGNNFYQDEDAPVAERVADVAQFLREHGIDPSSHLGCGAAANFAAIAENSVVFAQHSGHMTRLQALLPEAVYDQVIYQTITERIRAKLAVKQYETLSGDTFLQAAQTVGGDHAVEELQDDGRGVHGHVEEQIIRIKVDGIGINERKLSELTDGREVFGINDTRIDRLAKLFSRGNDQDYQLAYMALETFIDATHATLARDMPTYVITKTI